MSKDREQREQNVTEWLRQQSYSEEEIAEMTGAHAEATHAEIEHLLENLTPDEVEALKAIAMMPSEQRAELLGMAGSLSNESVPVAQFSGHTYFDLAAFADWLRQTREKLAQEGTKGE